MLGVKIDLNGILNNNVSVFVNGLDGFNNGKILYDELSKVVKNKDNIILIQPLDDKKSISIEQIREMFEAILYKPVMDDKRYIIIDSLDNMNDIGLNSILKILEEPKATEKFFLVNNNSNVIDTIKSRCINTDITLDMESLKKENTEFDDYMFVLNKFTIYNLFTSNKYKSDCLNDITMFDELLNCKSKNKIRYFTFKLMSAKKEMYPIFRFKCMQKSKLHLEIFEDIFDSVLEIVMSKESSFAMFVYKIIELNDE